MRNLLIAGAVLFGVHSGYQSTTVQRMVNAPPQLSELHDEVIMYSLTTCGYCKRLAAKLDDAQIDYIELFLDEDPTVQVELGEKLQEIGVGGGRIGVPLMDVKGYMLLSNPKLEDIEYYADLY